MTLDFSTSNRIIFHPGSIKGITELLLEFGDKVLIISGSRSNRIANLEKFLDPSKISYQVFQTSGEPTILSVKDGIRKARELNIDALIAIGGGSVIDTGKAISTMLTNPGELEDYLEVVGQAKPILHRAKPLIAIPTTAGTGSEVTRNAVIKVPSKKVKVSLRGRKIIPEVALIDPNLTLDTPSEITASTGMDALSQVIEPYISIKGNPFVDLICEDAIKKASDSLLNAFKTSDDLLSRENMCWVSLFGGIALANAGLGAVHGFAGVIGGMHDIPHGVICARLLPSVLEMNINAISERQPSNPILEKFRTITKFLTHSEKSEIIDGVRWLETLCEEMKIPHLGELGVEINEFPEIIQNAKFSSSMKGNPIELTTKELFRVLEKSH
jgi:alcohol dehydrogenase class IV